MAGSADVEAGRAYVTFYLRRVNYDRDVDKLQRDNEKLQNDLTDRPSQAAARAAGQPSSMTEAQVSLSSEAAGAIGRGAAGYLGGATAANLAKHVPVIRTLTGAAKAAAPAVNALGTVTAATATSTVAATAASTAAAPAIATTGTAAAGASTGFAAMAAAALPIIIPLAAVAAAATAVYVAIFKWDELPGIVKLLLVPMWPLVAVVKLAQLAFAALKIALLPVVLAFKALAAAVSLVTLPFRLVAGAVRGFVATVKAIPAAIAAVPGLLAKIGQAAWNMGKRVASAVASATAALARLAAGAARATVATGAAVARLPGQVANAGAAAVQSVSASVRSLGMSIAKAGAVAAGLSAAIVGPMTVAAKQFADYGDKIRGIQNEYQRFQLTAEETSLIIRVNEQTGESVQKLAEQLRDGTRDFSRWRNEVRASGTEMSGGGLTAALALSRAYYSLRESLTGLRLALGAAVAPLIQDTTEVITGAVRAVTAWIAANRPLIAQVFRIATTVGLVAGAVTTLGGVIAGAGAVLSPFTAGLAAIAAGLAIIEVRTGTGRSIWEAYGGAVRRVYETVVGYVGRMAAFVGKTMGGIRDALAAGDLAGAVNVAWSAAKVAWIAGLVELDRLTRGMFGGILANLAAGRWAAAGEAVMGALKIAWLEGINFLAGLWGKVVDAGDTAWTAMLQGFDAAMGGIRKAWAAVWETIKRTALVGFTWTLNNVFAPIAKWLAQNDMTGILAKKSQEGLQALVDAHAAMKASLDSPEEQAAEREAIDRDTAAAQQAREDALIDRRGRRETAADQARLDRETEIERLRRRQAELAAQGGADISAQLAANQAELDRAIQAAAAARAAADAAKPKEEDFAVGTKTESITRFSGEALALSVGRAAKGPEERTAKASEEQVKILRDIGKEMGLTLREVLRLWAATGFA